MIRQSQLPPRAPLRSKEIAYPSDELGPQNPPRNNRHKKSLSHSSVLEDQTAWMDDLLSDMNCPPGRLLCRSASDSVDFLDYLVPESMLRSLNDDDDSTSEGNGSGALESACIYGPNSPRRKANVDFIGNSVLTALSDCASHTQLPSHNEISHSSWPTPSESLVNDVGSTIMMNAEQQAEKSMYRYPRQRSRVRKLQYIAELERTVNTLQALESELHYKVSALLQQRLTLSVENSKLKQHMSRLQLKKLALDGEHQALQREADRMRMGLAKSSSQSRNKALLHQRPSFNHVNTSQDSWEMLDWAKLNLG